MKLIFNEVMEVAISDIDIKWKCQFLGKTAAIGPYK